MELRHLRYFVAVARELSFTRAARRLGIAQPPLGQQIRRLEEELQVTLLERSRRHVELTDAGRAFLDGAERTLRAADEAAAGARRAARGEVGELAVGYIASAGIATLPGLLREYRHAHPDVRLRLRQMPTSEQVRALGEKTLHTGLLGERPGEAWLAHRVLSREALLAVVPAGHPLASRGTIRLTELAGSPFVIHPRRAAAANFDRIVALCRAAGFTPDIQQEAYEMQTITGLVAAGMGVSLLPASVRSLGIEGVALLRLADPIEPAEVVAAWPRDDRSPVLRGFLDTVAAHPVAALG